MKFTSSSDAGILTNLEIYRKKIPSFMSDITAKFRVSKKNGISKGTVDISTTPSLTIDLYIPPSINPANGIATKKDLATSDVPTPNPVQKRTLGFVCLGLFYSLLAGVFFSISAATVKYLDTLDPGQVACYQYIAICVFSLPMVVRSGESLFGPTATTTRWIILCGIFDAITSYLAFVGYRYLPLSDASVITSSMPVFVTITARIFLKELCGKPQIFALGISVVGVALVSKVPLLLAHRADVYTRENIIGILASLGAVASESAVYVFLRKLHEVNSFVILFNFGWVATLSVGVFTAFAGEFSLTICGFQQWVVMAGGIFSFLCQMFLTKALELEDAGPVSVLMSAGDVLLAFLLDVVVFYELPDAYTISGTILIISSIVIVGFKKWISELPKKISFKKTLCLFGRF